MMHYHYNMIVRTKRMKTLLILQCTTKQMTRVLQKLSYVKLIKYYLLLVKLL